MEGMLKSYSQFAARIRVPSNFLLSAIYLIFAQPTRGLLIAGAVVAFAGLLLRATSTGYLEKNQRLATSGPYLYTRNPLYLGSLLAGIGFSIAGGRWWFFLLLGFLEVAVYWPVIRREEAHLRKLFPEEFDVYVRSVPVLLPRLFPNKKPRTPREYFRWDLYWRNREYQALLAYIVIMLFLLVKSFLTGGA